MILVCLQLWASFYFGKSGYKAVIERKKEAIRCPQCSKILEGVEKFCPECGFKLK